MQAFLAVFNDDDDTGAHFRRDRNVDHDPFGPQVFLLVLEAERIGRRTIRKSRFVTLE